jgi:serine protease Do
MPSMPLMQQLKTTKSRTMPGLKAAAAALMLGAATIVLPIAPLTAPAIARGAPESFAPLVEEVLDAVVNISASQTTENRTVPLPQAPPGTPFEDFFNDSASGPAQPAPRREPAQPGA